MSWGLDIVVLDQDNNEHWVEIIDSHTYNLTDMWDKAVPFLNVTKDFDGKICADILDDLKIGLMDIIDHRVDYIALNPSNGWGNFDIFFDAYMKLIQLVSKYPSGVLRWNG
jgi:hypothetical protein